MEQNAVTIWDQKSQQIYEIFGKPNELSLTEFEVFCQMGRALNLNPFLREIWATKAFGQTSIFVGRDGYRKNASTHPNYDGHIVDSIYSKDQFRVVGGIPEHSYGLGDRGELIGAYCLVYKKNMHPTYVRVVFSEYDKSVKPGEKNSYGREKKPNTWNTLPETMIKKVAEAQGLRMAFPDRFNGTYDESENWTNATSPVNAEYTEVKETKPKSYARKEVMAATDEEGRPWADVDIAEISPAEHEVLPKKVKSTYSPVYPGQDVADALYGDKGKDREKPRPKRTAPSEPVPPAASAPTPLNKSQREEWMIRILDEMQKHPDKLSAEESTQYFNLFNNNPTDAQIAKAEVEIYARIYDLSKKQQEVKKALGYMGTIGWTPEHIRNSVKRHLGTDAIEQVTDIPALINYQDHLRSEFKAAAQLKQGE